MKAALLGAVLLLVGCGPAPGPALPPVSRGAGHARPAPPVGPPGVQVSAAGITVDGRRVMATPAVKPGSPTRCDLPLDPLARALARRGERARPALRIQLGPASPFELVCSLLRVAWEAGHVSARLVPGAGATPVSLGPPPLPPRPKHRALKLTVVLGDRGLYVGGAGGVMPAPSGVGPSIPCKLRDAGRCARVAGRDPYDHQRLRALLRKIKQAYPKQRRLLLSADAAVPLDSVLGALVAARGAPGQGAVCAHEQGCLFDRAFVGSFALASQRMAQGQMLRQVQGRTRLIPIPADTIAGPLPSPASRVPPPLVRGPPGGTLNAASAAAVLRRVSRPAQSCYERALARDPSLRGEVALRLVVDPRGRVSAVTIDHDKLGDTRLCACLRAIMRRLRFPPSAGGNTALVVPLRFSPK